jgi:phosphatidyl-myo-inositol alpha-mannosyltransferase
VRVGIVCPYSWDVPGGVQVHVRDLAEELRRRGHTVSVLAPADDGTPVPPYVVTAGRAVPVRYNGSVARLTFGPLSANRVRRWLGDGAFDVVHVHEPATPSLSLLAVWWATVPVVATFHTSMSRSRAMNAAFGILQPAMEKITARVAVSEEARTTLVQHFGGDPVLIPNGLYVDVFATAERRPGWRGTEGTACFLGRLDEPRKGLPVLLDAWTDLVRERAGARLLVAGRGDVDEHRAGLPERVRSSVTFLGGVSEADKAVMLASSDVYVAPHTGGESFGIVLAEAMAAGTPVLASDLAAFRAVLDEGRLGVLVPSGDAPALTKALAGLLDDPSRRRRLSEVAAVAVRRYDWSRVTDDVLAVYEMAAASGRRPAPGDPPRSTG